MALSNVILLDVPVSSSDLGDIEERLDLSVASLEVWTRPRRALLTFFYQLIHQLMHGSWDGNIVARPAEGEALINRMSALARYVVAAPSLPTGAGAADVLYALEAEDAVALREALVYAHACELFPELWRDWFEVSEEPPGSGRFRLAHVDDVRANTDVRDILMSEIAIPMRLSSLRRDDPLRVGLLTAPGVLSTRGVALPLVHFQALHTFEHDLMDDAAMVAATGASAAEFARVQRALGAIAMTWLDIADEAATHARRAQREGRFSDRDAWFDEHLEWVAPMISADFLEGMAQSLTDVPRATLSRLLELFTLDPTAQLATDGYFPPLHYMQSEGGARMITFSPDALLHMTCQRNLLYAIQQCDKQLFDDLVSARLEPVLLDVIEAEFARVPGVIIRRNREWRSGVHAGEFDLLVHDPRDGVTLHLQAKAPVPPQGARMVTRLEDRVLEGAEQLARFRALGDEVKSTILEDALGLRADASDVRDCLVTRTSLGTARAWSAMDGVEKANPQLLRGAITRALAQEAPLGVILDLLSRQIDDLVREAVPHWEPTEVQFGPATAPSFSMSIPLLKFDPAPIVEARLTLTPQRTV